MAPSGPRGDHGQEVSGGDLNECSTYECMSLANLFHPIKALSFQIGD